MSASREYNPEVLPSRLARLKLDLDDTDETPQVTDFTQRLDRAGFEVSLFEMKRSPGGGGYHVLMELDPPPQTPMEVVALQALCGSDPMREACNFHRAQVLHLMPEWAWDAWNVLYKGW